MVRLNGKSIIKNDHKHVNKICLYFLLLEEGYQLFHNLAIGIGVQYRAKYPQNAFQLG